ncbi:MAG: ADP-forming succinate--CoA ligase subunit beta [Chlamydiia bacterium]|nr:ADP-forming succinate--CoA ligase subunit beta [Chlamydiia bacterium]
MYTHEYQAKRVLQAYGIEVPEFEIVRDAHEIETVVSALGIDQAILKVQVHAGGRGKAGGVRFAKSKEEMSAFAREMVGMQLVNQQTGPQGLIAHEVMVSVPVDIEKEYYLGIVYDRANSTAMLIASPEGGVEIEEVAAKTPEKILKIPLPLNGKLKGFQLFRVAKFLDWPKEAYKQGMQLIAKLARAFVETDAELFEINPLVLTKEGKIVALDAKLSVDDNALFRQKEIAGYFDPTQLQPNEVRAHQFDLAYVALDGTIGCMVNGAGLAMATMDIIQHFGGTPANFLDVGGGASEEKVAEGFKIILSDNNVKAILVNIFGGIMNCETLAKGIVKAATEMQIHVPLIVRMEGTNVDKGREILKQSGLKIEVADDLISAAKKANEAAKE